MTRTSLTITLLAASQLIMCDSPQYSTRTDNTEPSLLNPSLVSTARNQADGNLVVLNTEAQDLLLSTHPDFAEASQVLRIMAGQATVRLDLSRMAEGNVRLFGVRLNDFEDVREGKVDLEQVVSTSIVYNAQEGGTWNPMGISAKQIPLGTAIIDNTTDELVLIMLGDEGVTQPEGQVGRQMRNVRVGLPLGLVSIVAVSVSTGATVQRFDEVFVDRERPVRLEIGNPPPPAPFPIVRITNKTSTIFRLESALTLTPLVSSTCDCPYLGAGARSLLTLEPGREEIRLTPIRGTSQPLSIVLDLEQGDEIHYVIQDNDVQVVFDNSQARILVEGPVPLD